MTDAERASAINNITTQLEKAKEEILAAVEKLGQTPETDAAMARLTSISQSLDDLNEDAGQEPPPTP